MLVLGIDQSTSSTGMVLLTHDAPNRADAYYNFQPKKKLSKYEKQALLLEKLDIVVREHQPDFIVIEGYGLNLKHPSAIIPLAELSGLLKFWIHASERAYIAPEPGVWKQVLMGEKKGNAKKEDIAAFMFGTMGIEYGVQDLYDAHALAWVGLAFKGMISGLTAFQRGKLGEISML